MENLLANFFNHQDLANENCMVPSKDLMKMFEICLFLAEKINEEKNHVVATAKKIGNRSKDIKQKNSELKARINMLEETKINENEEYFNLDMIKE